MSETKTETLVDVLRDLSHYSDRFQLRYWRGRMQNFKALIQVACQEECEARGWSWFIARETSPTPYYDVEINDESQTPSRCLAHTESEGSAALAIATALRDALEAEESE